MIWRLARRNDRDHRANRFEGPGTELMNATVRRFEHMRVRAQSTVRNRQNVFAVLLAQIAREKRAYEPVRQLEYQRQTVDRMRFV